MIDPFDPPQTADLRRMSRHDVVVMTEERTKSEPVNIDQYSGWAYTFGPRGTTITKRPFNYR